MKNLSALNKVIFFINNILALLLLLSTLASYIKPSTLSVAPLLSLATPVLLILNIIFVIYWVVLGLKKQFILSLIALIISLFISSSPIKFNSKNNPSDNGISVMSYNVRKFNIYNWIDDTNIDSKISAFITKEDPDIISFQEYRITKKFSLNYPYFSNPLVNNYSDSVMNNKFKSSLSIFSKYPIINDGIVKYNRFKHSAMFVDVVINKDTIRIYNFHLASLGVIPNQEYFGHDDSEKLIKGLSGSLKIQQIQINSLRQHVKNCNYKIIFNGDMNNTAYSWVYKNLKNDLQDSFLETGNGFGKTYNFKGFPLRIDFIFADNDINIISHKNFKDKYSDHYPIMATVSF